jgi:hypothetical protein
VTSLSAADVGRTGVPFDVRVERGRIRDLARASGATSEEHYAEDGAAAPVTIVSGIARLTDFPGADPLQPGDLDLSRVLAAGAEFRYPNGPLRDGERLKGQASISAVYTKEGSRGLMTFVEQTTRLESPSGELRAEYVALMIEMPRSRTHD